MKKLILIAAIALAGCNYNKYADYKLPIGYNIVKNSSSEYAIKKYDGGILSYNSRYNEYGFDSDNPNEVIVSNDSCYLKFRFSEYMKSESDKDFK